jgi:hypothetical protein
MHIIFELLCEASMLVVFYKVDSVHDAENLKEWKGLGWEREVEEGAELESLQDVLAVSTAARVLRLFPGRK